MHEFQTKVRFSETDEKHVLTLSALLNYLQDCCAFQGEAIHRGFDDLAARNLAWVLGGWEIHFHRLPVFMEELTIRTWPTGFRGFFGYRCFDIATQEGELLVEANSTWLLINAETGRVTRATEELLEVYELTPANDVPLPAKHLSLDPTGEIKEHRPVTVQKWHLDANHHMNNAQYVRIAQEYNDIYVSKRNSELKKLRVLYRKAAMLGDVLYPFSFTLENKVQVMLCTEERQPYAIVEFEY